MNCCIGGCGLMRNSKFTSGSVERTLTRWMFGDSGNSVQKATLQIDRQVWPAASQHRPGTCMAKSKEHTVFPTSLLLQSLTSDARSMRCSQQGHQALCCLSTAQVTSVWWGSFDVSENN